MEKKEKKVVIEVGEGAAIPNPQDKGLVSAWRLSLAVALAILFYLLVFKTDPYLRIFKFLPDGILVTFQVTGQFPSPWPSSSDCSPVWAGYHKITTST